LDAWEILEVFTIPSLITMISLFIFKFFCLEHEKVDTDIHGQNCIANEKLF